MSYNGGDYNRRSCNCSDDPSLYPLFTKEIIYGYMTHKYSYQKDITYAKALDYVNDGRIYALKSNLDCSVFEAKSLGSDGKIYNCELTLSNKRIIGFKCTCMSYLKWHTLCKHLIGMMILIENRRLKLLERQSIAPVRNATESNFTIYTCANCGTKYRKYEKICPLCGNDKHLIGIVPEKELQRMHEVKEQLDREKRQSQKQNDISNNSQNPTDTIDGYNSNYRNVKTSDNTPSDNNKWRTWLIGILIYVAVSVILGLMCGSIGFGFIASIVLFIILGIIERMFF